MIRKQIFFGEWGGDDTRPQLYLSSTHLPTAMSAAHVQSRTCLHLGRSTVARAVCGQLSSQHKTSTHMLAWAWAQSLSIFIAMRVEQLHVLTLMVPAQLVAEVAWVLILHLHSSLDCQSALLLSSFARDRMASKLQ